MRKVILTRMKKEESSSRHFGRKDDRRETWGSSLVDKGPFPAKGKMSGGGKKKGIRGRDLMRGLVFLALEGTKTKNFQKRGGTGTK